jgi:hypothetical protein
VDRGREGVCVGQFHRIDVFGTPLLWGDDLAIDVTFVSGPDDSIGSPKAFNFEKIMRTGGPFFGCRVRARAKSGWLVH